jgi:ABC-type phosphate transport system auxiliary subunit
LEQEVQRLSRQLENESEKRTASELSELEQLHSQLRATSDQLAQTRDENTGVLKEQLNGTVPPSFTYIPKFTVFALERETSMLCTIELAVEILL